VNSEKVLMELRRPLKRLGLCCVLPLVLGGILAADTETVLHNFTGLGDGRQPNSRLVSDSSGALYGTTQGTGQYGNGTIFKLTPPGRGKNYWTETTLYAFSGATDGGGPAGALTFGRSGSLYGTTAYGGEFGYGTVFQLSPRKNGNDSWIETVLYNFTGASDGGQPGGGVIFDKKGSLYGTTQTGGNSSRNGTVFKLTPPKSVNTPWAERVLYAFDGVSNTVNPLSGLIFDNTGALYGTTVGGGQSHCGSVFQLVPPTKGQSAWTETDSYSFTCGADGENPYSTLVFDDAGALYGTTDNGGNFDYGVVFRLAPSDGRNNQRTETVLYSFTGDGDGAYPIAGPLVFDKAGGLYGTTSGAPVNYGSVFKLLKKPDGWTEITLYQFTGGMDGGNPVSGLLLRDSKLWGTTALGGAFGNGTAFKVGR
jgi:uncharacterized repeat protein (TIGR03803 family)